jgi:putative NADPH-quinone reductase
MKHLLMQVVGHPHEDELRHELNAMLARITATLQTVVKNDEDSE